MATRGEKGPSERRAIAWLLPLIAVVALGAWWLGRRSAAPPRAPTAPSTVAGERRLEQSSPSRVATAAPVGAADESPRDKIRSDLRAKLATSVGDFLAALHELAKTDPALAIDLAHEFGRTDEEKWEWTKNTMQIWADKDVQAAWDWLGKLSHDRMQELAGGELGSLVLGTMARQDPSKVIGNLDTLLRNGNSSESISTAVAVHLGVAALVENGKLALARETVDRWARDPAKLNLEAAAFATVAMEMAKAAPQETGAWLRSLPVNPERNDAMAAFTATWAEKDPRAALQWADTLAPNEGRNHAVQRTVADWIEQYPTEVSGWVGDYLSRAPPGPETDNLIGAVVNGSPTLRRSPQSALQWVALISDPQQRVQQEEQVVVRWGGLDKPAAADYVARSTTIPPERKSELLQRIQNAEPPE